MNLSLRLKETFHKQALMIRQIQQEDLSHS